MGLIRYRSSSAGKARPIPDSEDRKASHRFLNSARWIKTRAIKLSLDPLCERCEAKGETVEAVDVHHVQARSKRPDLALDLANLESLCKQCHTLEELARRKRGTSGTGDTGSTTLSP